LAASPSGDMISEFIMTDICNILIVYILAIEIIEKVKLVEYRIQK